MGKSGDKAEIVASVRGAVAAEDFSGAEQLLHSYQEEKGITPKGVEALSWLARGSLAAQRFEKAADYAQTAHRSAVELLSSLDLDSETFPGFGVGSLD